MANYNKRNSSDGKYDAFNAAEYVAAIERRISDVFSPNDAKKMIPASVIDLSAPETWPVLMELAEVAQALRYDDEDTVRDITNMPVDEGGLRYLSIGAGRKRRKRLVLKVDLLEFLSRNSVSPTRVEVTNSKRRKPRTEISTGSLMARSARKPTRS